jgi:hypothetical protein
MDKFRTAQQKAENLQNTNIQLSYNNDLVTIETAVMRQNMTALQDAINELGCSKMTKDKYESILKINEIEKQKLAL